VADGDYMGIVTLPGIIDLDDAPDLDNGGYVGIVTTEIRVHDVFRINFRGVIQGCLTTINCRHAI